MKAFNMHMKPRALKAHRSVHGPVTLPPDERMYYQERMVAELAAEHGHLNGRPHRPGGHPIVPSEEKTRITTQRVPSKKARRRDRSRLNRWPWKGYW